MQDDGREAASKAAGESRRKTGKTLGSAKRSSGKTARLQLHIGEETAKRLGVHCALVSRNQSAEVDRLLLRFLTREGKGRELFASEDLDPDAD